MEKEKEKSFWDNFDEKLYQEYLRRKAAWRAKMN